MTMLPDWEEQILSTHAAFVHEIVRACHHPEHARRLEPAFKAAVDNGWGTLIGVVRDILKGRRDEALLSGLDREDGVIARAILRGLQDPGTLPDATPSANPAMAAPGLAAMIRGAANGDVEALQILGSMAENMHRAGGDMARLAAALRPMINGERDSDKLCKGMGAAGQHLVQEILETLNKNALH